jgi:hypothetical protein
MLTKGDVLAFLGKASGPMGTYKETPPPMAQAQPKKEEYKVRFISDHRIGPNSSIYAAVGWTCSSPINCVYDAAKLGQGAESLYG